MSKEPLHGYALLKRLREVLGHERLGTGVLYPALRSLRSKGLIDVRSEVRGSRVVKVYYITDEGIAYLSDRKRELGEVLSFVRKMRELRELGVDRVLRSISAIHSNLDKLDEEKKRMIAELFEEFEKRVLGILGGENG